MVQMRYLPEATGAGSRNLERLFKELLTYHGPAWDVYNTACEDERAVRERLLACPEMQQAEARTAAAREAAVAQNDAVRRRVKALQREYLAAGYTEGLRKKVLALLEVLESV